MKRWHVTACAACLAACSPGAKTDPSRPAPVKSLSQRLNEKNGYAQDENGNWVPVGDKRSSFENKGPSPYFTGREDKKEFKAGEFQRKSWWGNRSFELKRYDGDTDGSRFATRAAQDGKGARESGRDAGMNQSYATWSREKGTAREAGERSISKPSDAETDARRRVYQAPEVIDWQAQRSLSVEQSRSLLGR